ncbi:glutamate--tRNA ligase [Weissella sagaensis]|jgi:nondiscriminating glutamyl-tRNA synthetase|uniref:Glutamate--tRNA ligase n=1 Tax=Weissella sagaensis TaxID=2559928 RepID=A0ABW1RU55_9LACO|nr:glutamate--tRNA ligase [Weissella sagaensis]KAA8433329.1 glutamate--tRNA ligase [Weissella paramesenteroides]KAA8439240.1 glutamate--tRNA ligase [Weissella paramesenteroides]QDJ59309.1 glutamate--tRNA ligase [Weissella hellenica]UEG67432.1 glutamate--tRNA ligase [Weissella hellenica]
MAETTEKKIRVRYAPSPTGHLHIGNARTALFNWLFARHHKGEFIIRIEDTDQTRNIADGEKSQLDNLAWLGLDWDESPANPGQYGPYRQSERLSIYKPLIQDLLDRGLAYRSFKTSEELAAEREAQVAAKQAPHYVYEYADMSEEEIAAFQADALAKGMPYVVRFRVPENKDYAWDDIVKGHIEINSSTVGGDWVIQKADGMPTYNFAVVVDDHMMEISHVLRGDDHVSNTPKQLMIYDAFDWEAPIFGHMTLIINADTGKKLSKRDETVLQFIEQYRALGYLPEALLNFIVLLGWSPVGEKEIFNKKQLVKLFDEARLSKSPAKFDNKKLEWVNNQWIKTADQNMVFDKLIEQLVYSDVVKPEELTAEKMQWLRSVMNVYMDGVSFTAQIVPLIKPVFFEMPAASDIPDSAKEWMNADNVTAMLNLFIEKIEKMPIFTATAVLKAIREIQSELDVKGRALWNPLRIATTREEQGPNLGELLELLGREQTLANIREFL